jgi:hypothetical protein
MSFMFRDGWYCQFLEEDLKTSLPRKVTLKTEDQVKEMARRGGGLKDQEARMMLEQGIKKGRGVVFLSLTGEQYAKLKR